jgi:hypothetical protein
MESDIKCEWRKMGQSVGTMVKNLCRSHHPALFLLLLMSFPCSTLRSQGNWEGNISKQMGGGTLAGRDPNTTLDLTSMLMTVGSRSSFSTSLYQRHVSKQILRSLFPITYQYQLLPMATFDVEEYNLNKTFLNESSNQSIRLSPDLKGLKTEGSPWYTSGNLEINKPIIGTSMFFDTNSTSAPSGEGTKTLYQNGYVTLQMLYGRMTGMTGQLNMEYKPGYAHFWTEDAGDEVSHQALMEYIKPFGASAAAFFNDFSMSQQPIIELPGRTQVVNNSTGFKFLKDVSPKTMFRTDFVHEYNERSRTSDSSTTMIEEDALALELRTQILRKTSFIITMEGSVTQFSEGRTYGQAFRPTVAIFLTPKLVLNVAPSVLVQQPPEGGTKISNLYDFVLRYSPRQKWDIEVKHSRRIRPSFVDNGVFINVEEWYLMATFKVLTRFLIGFSLEHGVRSSDDSLLTKGLNQESIGYGMELQYLISRSSSVSFNAFNYELEDLNDSIQTSRTIFGVQFNYVF